MFDIDFSSTMIQKQNKKIYTLLNWQIIIVVQNNDFVIHNIQYKKKN